MEFFFHCPFTAILFEFQQFPIIYENILFNFVLIIFVVIPAVLLQDIQHSGWANEWEVVKIGDDSFVFYQVSDPFHTVPWTSIHLIASETVRQFVCFLGKGNVDSFQINIKLLYRCPCYDTWNIGFTNSSTKSISSLGSSTWVNNKRLLNVKRRSNLRLHWLLHRDLFVE